MTYLSSARSCRKSLPQRSARGWTVRPGTGRIRVQYVASQLVGVVMARYILELDPFRSLPVEQIAETIGPNLQRYLTGDLPGFA